MPSARGVAAPWRGFSRVGGAVPAQAPAARLNCLSCPWASRCPAPSGHTAQPGGRAKRGLDLFLGQNRTNRGSGDATAP